MKKKKSNIGRHANNNRNGYFFVAPYAIVFVIFILIPVILAAVLSFTNFNAIEWPSWVGFLNYITLITSDEVFMYCPTRLYMRLL